MPPSVSVSTPIARRQFFRIHEGGYHPGMGMESPPHSALPSASAGPSASSASSADPPPRKTPPQSLTDTVAETVQSALVAVILALIFRAFVLQPFIIPSGSMAT